MQLYERLNVEGDEQRELLSAENLPHQKQVHIYSTLHSLSASFQLLKKE